MNTGGGLVICLLNTVQQWHNVSLNKKHLGVDHWITEGGGDYSFCYGKKKKVCSADSAKKKFGLTTHEKNKKFSKPMECFMAEGGGYLVRIHKGNKIIVWSRK